MRVVSFEDASKHEIGEKIPCFRGKLIRVNPFKEGHNDKGAWSIQNVEVCDPENPRTKLRVKLFNFPEVQRDWTNHLVEILSAEGERGLKGVTVKKDEYNWREGQPIKKIVEVYFEDGASFHLAGAESHQRAPQNTTTESQSRPANASKDVSGHAPAQTQPTRSTRQGPLTPEPQAQTRKAPPADLKQRVREAAVFAGKKVNGFRIVMKAVDKLQDERREAGRPLSAEQYQGICTSIFISGDRAYMWENIPSKADELEMLFPKGKEPVEDKSTEAGE